MDKLLKKLYAFWNEPKGQNKPEYENDPEWKPGIPGYIDVDGRGRAFCQDPKTMRMNSASHIMHQINERRNPTPVDDDPWAAALDEDDGILEALYGPLRK